METRTALAELHRLAKIRGIIDMINQNCQQCHLLVENTMINEKLEAFQNTRSFIQNLTVCVRLETVNSSCKVAYCTLSLKAG